MPERGFDTAFWDDPFVQNLSKDGKLLFVYLWTNNHCNQAGLYEITPRTIAFETSLPEADIPELLQSLSPKVEWYSDFNLIWVKNFIKRQSKSPKFLVAVAKSLTRIHHNDAVHEVINYNKKRYSILIPYQYYMDSIPIPPASASVSVPVTNNVPTKRNRVVKGKGLSPDEGSILDILGKLLGWHSDPNDIIWLRGFMHEFPQFILADFKACIDYHSGREPPKHKGIWKNRFRNWMVRKQEFAMGTKRVGDENDPDKYVKGKYGHMVQR